VGTCSIPACGDKTFGKGWCAKHYQRWYKQGDPLKVLRIRGESLVDLTCPCGKTFKLRASVQRKKIKAGTVTLFCSMECKIAAETTTDVVASFWSKVDKKGPDDCWEWNAGKDKDGYGLFTLTAIGTIKAHRFAFELADGTIDPDLMVCHSCDNPPCCNRRHLWQGNNQKNQADMAAKGRHGTRPAAPGSRNTKAKLVDVDVLSIRERAARGERASVMAKEYRLSYTNVRHIILRKIWTLI
jgi:hypothetical protein